jgi:hypothetical protein
MFNPTDRSDPTDPSEEQKMQFSVTDLSYDGKWYRFSDDVELKIRPFPLRMGKVLLQDGALVFSQKEQCAVFEHSLEAWKGVVGSDGEVLPCTEEVKRKIFDFRLAPDLVQFVVNKAREFLSAKETQEKNLKTGDDGPSPRTA